MIARSLAMKQAHEEEDRSADRDPRGRLMGTPSAESADARLGPRARVGYATKTRYPALVSTHPGATPSRSGINVTSAAAMPAPRTMLSLNPEAGA